MAVSVTRSRLGVTPGPNPREGFCGRFCDQMRTTLKEPQFIGKIRISGTAAVSPSDNSIRNTWAAFASVKTKFADLIIERPNEHLPRKTNVACGMHSMEATSVPESVLLVCVNSRGHLEGYLGTKCWCHYKVYLGQQDEQRVKNLPGIEEIVCLYTA